MNESLALKSTILQAYMHNGVYFEIHLRHEGVVTHPQSQTRTEQAAWLKVQLRDQHTIDQGIPAIPTAKVTGVVYVFQHTPHYACLAVKLISASMIHSH